MKTVLTNRELPHKWAHQTQPDGRNANRSFWFRGSSIYSYNAEIGRIIKRKGKTAYIINDTTYSVTTTQHQSRMRRAIPSDAILFYIGNLGRSSMPDNKYPGMMFDYAIEQASEAAAKASRARSNKEWLLNRQAEWLAKAKCVSEFFGLRRKVDDKAIERRKERIIAEEKRRAKEAREREAAREKEFQDRIQQWLAGEAVQFPYSIQRVYLRIVDHHGPPENYMMETSRGVRVPIADAERAFRFAISRKEKGWRRNGEECKVGDYQLDAINEQGVVAGCHRIEWAEVERFAKQQGWI